MFLKNEKQATVKGGLFCIPIICKGWLIWYDFESLKLQSRLSLLGIEDLYSNILESERVILEIYRPYNKFTKCIKMKAKIHGFHCKQFCDRS